MPPFLRLYIALYTFGAEIDISVNKMLTIKHLKHLEKKLSIIKVYHISDW